MTVNDKLESLLVEARGAIASLNTGGRTVGDVVDQVGAVRYAEGRLIGFLDALLITDPNAARSVTPRIEGFVAEAIAARMLLN
jgi:hypothetical protein